MNDYLHELKLPSRILLGPGPSAVRAVGGEAALSGSLLTPLATMASANRLQGVDARLDVSGQARDGEADLFQANLVTCSAPHFQNIKVESPQLFPTTRSEALAAENAWPLSVTPPQPHVQAAHCRATPCCVPLRQAVAAGWGRRPRCERAAAEKTKLLIHKSRSFFLDLRARIEVTRP